MTKRRASIAPAAGDDRARIGEARPLAQHRDAKPLEPLLAVMRRDGAR